MPLNADAHRRILENLEAIAQNKKVRPVPIGRLTEAQLAALQNEQTKRGFPVIEGGEVIFHGKHVYESRVIRNGYSIEDVIAQITSAMDEVAICKGLTAIQNVVPRDDGYGNRVRDKAVFECTARRPKLELISVVPTGDHIKPAEAKAKEKGRSVAAPVELI